MARETALSRGSAGMVLGAPRSQLALEGLLHRQRKLGTKLLLLTTCVSCAKWLPHRWGVQQAKKAIDRERARFHIAHTAVRAGRVQAGVFLSNFFSVL